MVGFDIMGARNSGYRDDEILSYLKKQKSNIDWDGLEHISKRENINSLDILANDKNWGIYQEDMTKEPVKQKSDKNINKQKEELKPKEVFNQSKLAHFLNNTFEMLGFGISEDERKYRKDLQNNIDAAILNNTIDKLGEEERNYLAERGTLYFGELDNDEEFKKLKTIDEKNKYIKDSEIKRALDKRKKELELINKDEIDINDEDIRFIKQNRDFFDSLIDNFRDDREIAKDYVERKRAKDVITPEIHRAIEMLDRVHESKSLASIITGGDEEERKDYLDSVYKIASANGFDDIGTDDKGELYFFKGDKAYKASADALTSLKESLINSSFSIAGGVAGAIRGSARGLGGAVIGGAIGSGIGSQVDTAIANNYLNREHRVNDYIRNALTDGVLSLVGDGAVALGVKLFKGANNILSKASDYIPVIGSVKRFKNGNYSAARKLIDSTVDRDEIEAIKSFSKEIGGGIKTDKNEVFQKFIKENGKFAKLAKITQDLLFGAANKDKQQELFNIMRGDESGSFIAFISQVANESPELNKKLRNILSQTTYNLKKSINAITHNKAEVNEILNLIEKNGKEAYGAIEDSLIKNYDEIKIKLDSNKFENFKKELQESGAMDESTLNYLNFIKGTIYNDEGASLRQLSNARKNLNSFYKEASIGVKEHFKKAAQSFLKDDVDSGIQKILSKKPELEKKAKELFESAIEDYSNIKGTLRLADEIGLRDKRLSYEQSFDRLFRFLKGKGELKGGEHLSNLKALLRGVGKENVERVEVGILQGLFNKFLKEGGYDQVFDSGSFLKALDGLDFESKGAKDFIEITKGFDRLFKNDYKISQNLVLPSIKSPGSSIATSVEGAFKFQIIKNIFGTLVRILPEIPLLKGLNEGIQSASLRHQIKMALKNASSVENFKKELQVAYSKPGINLKSRQVLKEFEEEVERLETRLKDETRGETQKQNAKNHKQEYGIDEDLKLFLNKDELEIAKIARDSTEIDKKLDLTEEQTSILRELRLKIENNTIRPISEFGINYAEHFRNGGKAIKKIMNEAMNGGENYQGQVAGAFYKEGLGYIDVVWGKITDPIEHKGYGLSHILDKRTAEFIQEGLSKEEAEVKVREFVESIPQIIEVGKVMKDDKGRLRIEFDDFIVGINDNWKGEPTNKWIVTSYVKKENGESLYASSPITKGETLPLNSKEDSNKNKQPQKLSIL